VTYEDYARREVVDAYVEDNPSFQSGDIRYTPRSNTAWKAVGYVGFGAGALSWNNFFVNVQKKLPETTYVESFLFSGSLAPEDVTIYRAEFTDERYQLNVGNEMHVTLVPQRLDVGWALVYGEYTDADNDVVPSDDDQTIFSTLVRAQLYVTPTVHLLAEGVVAKETSHNGNRYRNHEDSIFQSENGQPNTLDGLEFGDADVRDTLQGKFGVVLNPAGVGLFNRPSLRVLYGVQWSSQNNAFGNSFSDDVSDDAKYGTQERHLHHVIGFEAEAWF
jgi:hypothetical protein